MYKPSMIPTTIDGNQALPVPSCETHLGSIALAKVRNIQVGEMYEMW
jgi:hypothetical protein